MTYVLEEMDAFSTWEEGTSIRGQPAPPLPWGADNPLQALSKLRGKQCSHVQEGMETFCSRQRAAC